MTKNKNTKSGNTNFYECDSKQRDKRFLLSANRGI